LRDLSLQEEISHCAAGVRWLKHLHKVATFQPPSDQTAAAAAADAGGQTETNGSTEQQQQQQSQKSNGSIISAAAAAAAADWATDARKYETVEEWFHSLIRSHLKGTLKV
jgi:ribosomal protein L16 Arg81 hydroxylase